MRLTDYIRPHYSDRQLVEKYRKTGRVSYLAELYQRYLHLIFNVALKYLKVKEDAEDISMKVYEILTTRLPEQLDNPAGWLHRVTRNESLMLLRSRKREEKIVAAEFVENTEPAHQYEEEDQKQETNLQKLEKCLQELKHDQRKCVELFYLQQKCYKEVANLTGFELSQVKSHIQNGKRNLKICMEGR